MKDAATAFLSDLMNVDHLTEPRMPRIKQLPTFGHMGFAMLACTTGCDRTVRSMTHAPHDFAAQWIARSTAAACTAGPPLASGAAHHASAVDPKPMQLFAPPSADAKGGTEKLLNEDPASGLLEVVT